jgi:GntR family transcriptional repressor for pyruvate dehydrogenase complex
MTSPDIRVPKFAELVAGHIRNRIVRGELVRGEALPSESALMEDFDISRPTLREAFRILESEGLITVRRGSRGGARVQIPEANVAARYAGFVLQNRGTTVADVLDARVVVESPAAGIVARRPDHQACGERLHDWLRDAASDVSSRMFIETFNEFNRLLVSMTENETLILLTTMLEHIGDAATANYTSVVHEQDERLARQALRTRTLLADLIQKGDDKEAERLWRKHLTDSAAVVAADRATTVVDLLS